VLKLEAVRGSCSESMDPILAAFQQAAAGEGQQGWSDAAGGSEEAEQVASGSAEEAEEEEDGEEEQDEEGALSRVAAGRPAACRAFPTSCKPCSQSALRHTLRPPARAQCVAPRLPETASAAGAASAHEWTLFRCF
jgi:hypothetical protein